MNKPTMERYYNKKKDEKGEYKEYKFANWTKDRKTISRKDIEKYGCPVCESKDISLSHTSNALFRFICKNEECEYLLM